MFNRTTVWVERTTTDVFACPSKFYLLELPIENPDIILFNDIQCPSGSEKYFLNISPTQSCSQCWVPSPTVIAAVSDLRRTVSRKWLLFRHGPTPRCYALHLSISVIRSKSCRRRTILFICWGPLQTQEDTRDTRRILRLLYNSRPSGIQAPELEARMQPEIS